jgi:TRAP-type C4-dicarboxylate transport system substrate-binding protein
MKLTTKRALAPILVVAVLGASSAGCRGSGGDKAGGSHAPVVLRLAAADDAEQPDAQLVRRFASRVAELSGDSLRVRVVWDAAGQQTANYEAQIAEMVRHQRFDLGWIGARAWDRLGITSFQALQAPFLVTDHALLGRVATGPLGSRMVSELDDHGFVGLALVPDRLRYVFGVRHPLTSPGDFAHARVRVFPSRSTDALIHALGATPVHVSGDDVAAAVANGEIDGAEAALGTNSADEGENQLAANLAVFAKTLTLFAGGDAFERLDDDQRAVLRRAARETATFAAAHSPSESALIHDFCSSGRSVAVVTASRDDLAALNRAARPVYAELERDPGTRTMIAAIRALKGDAAAPAAGPQTECAPRTAALAGASVSRSTLNGTYHWRVTSAGARAAGGSADSPDVGIVGKMTLRDGKWRMGETDPEDYSGSYEIKGDHLVFDWADSTLTFAFERDADGGLALKPVPPMNLGDAVVWAGGPWRRVGPPVRTTP